MMLGFALLICMGIVCFIYLLVIKPRSYWKRKNVRSGVMVPIFGNSLKMVFGKEPFAHMISNLYNEIPSVRYLGGYFFTTPMLVLRCPNLIKQICIKDFDHVLNRKTFASDEKDILMSRNLVALKGQEWKEMRCTMSPSFTTSKLKAIFSLMLHNAESFVNYFIDKNEDVVEVVFKDASSRYTNDVIANSVFGLEVDSLRERNNEFYRMGFQVTDFSIRKKLSIFLIQLLPSVASFFGITFFGSKVQNFFINLVKETLKLREERNIQRPDMLGILLEAKKGRSTDEPAVDIKESNFAAVKEHLEMKDVKKELSDTDIAAQTFIFFFGGFESVSTAICFIAHELAANPDIQRRLIDEIDEQNAKNEKPSYDMVVSMVYLDMVVSEALRKWPAVVGTDRIVTKPYTIYPDHPDEQPVHLEVNDYIMIPSMAIHHDPKYFENPHIFDPERFSPVNRKNIDIYTYLPFGVGPRNCIGSRFALLEIKTLFLCLLSKFEIVPVKKSDMPLRIKKSSMILTSETGFLLGLKRRM